MPTMCLTLSSNRKGIAASPLTMGSNLDARSGAHWTGGSRRYSREKPCALFPQPSIARLMLHAALALDGIIDQLNGACGLGAPTNRVASSLMSAGLVTPSHVGLQRTSSIYSGRT